MKTNMKIAIIGAGNVAWHLSINIEKHSPHRILYVTSRTLQGVEELCTQLYEAKAKYDMDFVKVDLDLVLIAASDDALHEIATKLKVKPSTIVAHTSGTQPLSVLDKFERYGVFYPLQTFSKSTPLDIQNVPFCIEGSDNRVELLLLGLAQRFNDQASIISSSQRKTLHLAAVFACNFTNHLLHHAFEILGQDQISVDLLKPLIKETLQKALKMPPHQAQTGPAQRKDQDTMDQHLLTLQDWKDYKSEIYQLISQSIIDTSNIE